jgi:hypothetical protein
MPGITIIISTVLSLLGLAIAFVYMKKVTSVPLTLGLEDKDASRLTFIHGAIAKGAMAFLKQEYRFLTIFMIAFAAIIALLIDDKHTPDTREGIYTAIAFLFGGAISIASGYIGMKVATQGNARTTVSAKAVPPSRCSPVWAAVSSPRRPTWAPTSWARWNRAFLKTIRATPQLLPITWATTWVTWLAWAPTCSVPAPRAPVRQW